MTLFLFASEPLLLAAPSQNTGSLVVLSVQSLLTVLVLPQKSHDC